MARRRLRGTAAALAITGTLVVGSAVAANAAGYLISPYLTGNKGSYYLSGCTMFSEGWGSSEMSAFEHKGSCEGSIGIRVENADGNSSSIEWGAQRATADAPNFLGLVARYKLYHY